MLPGPRIIRACPHCKELLIENTLSSGNTMGAILWSDSKMDAPMLPNYPNYVVCPSCRNPLWIRDAELIDEVWWEDWDDPKYKSAKFTENASILDYSNGLKNSELSTEKEKYLRIRLMWAYNDPFRKDPSLAYELIPEQKQNLIDLNALLNDGSIDSIIMSSEIHRELGEFDQAIKKLEALRDSQFSPIIKKLSGLSKDKIPRVVELPN